MWKPCCLWARQRFPASSRRRRNPARPPIIAFLEEIPVLGEIPGPLIREVTPEEPEQRKGDNGRTMDTDDAASLPTGASHGRRPAKGSGGFSYASTREVHLTRACHWCELDRSRPLIGRPERRVGR